MFKKKFRPNESNKLKKEQNNCFGITVACRFIYFFFVVVHISLQYNKNKMHFIYHFLFSYRSPPKDFIFCVLFSHQHSTYYEVRFFECSTQHRLVFKLIICMPSCNNIITKKKLQCEWIEFSNWNLWHTCNNSTSIY